MPSLSLSNEHECHNCPLRLSHEVDDRNANEQVNTVQESTSHAWCTTVQEEDNSKLEEFQIVFGNDAKASNTPVAAQHGELVAYTNDFPVREEVNTTPVESTTKVYVDSAASSHVVSEASLISKHVVKRTDCSVRIKGSCGTSSATKKGTLKFGLKNDKEETIPVRMEVLLVPNLQ